MVTNGLDDGWAHNVNDDGIGIKQLKLGLGVNIIPVGQMGVPKGFFAAHARGTRSLDASPNHNL